MPDANSRIELRRALRGRRAALAPDEVSAASAAAASRLARSPEFVRARRIAGYVAVRGEPDPRAALEAALADGKSVYLPRIVENRMLDFAAWQPETVMRDNRFGIPEPEPDTWTIAPAALDLVIVPLVAFDAAGDRLGNGAGYYDRTFAFRRTASRPLLAGFAYAFQQRPRLTAADWDVPLDLVVTERGIERFHPGERR